LELGDPLSFVELACEVAAVNPVAIGGEEDVGHAPAYLLDPGPRQPTRWRTEHADIADPVADKGHRAVEQCGYQDLAWLSQGHGNTVRIDRFDDERDWIGNEPEAVPVL